MNEIFDEVKTTTYKPPMTNAQRIRAMTDEELAEFIMYDFASDDYGTLVHDKVLFFTVNDLIAWLQQPCGGADHE